MKKIASAVQMFSDAQNSRSMRERVNTCLQTRKRRPDEGALLVEVLVGMLILVIVFTATTIALSGMADQRVYIEQRDQAIALLSTYEEQSRIFRCGYVVDVIDYNLVDSTDPASGQAKLVNDVDRCDFAAKEAGNPGRNPGDQSFSVSREINEINSERDFHIEIRYWWEIPGSNVHNQDCTLIRGKGELPSILTRAVQVTWLEKGVERREVLIKRDAVPNDNVVFASGNRKSILASIPASVPPTSTSRLALDGTRSIYRILDGLMGQPTDCVWFPYITPNGTDREVLGIGGTAAANFLDSVEPQGAVIAS